MKLFILMSSFLMCSAAPHEHGSFFRSISKEISGSENTTVFSVTHLNALLNGIGFKQCSVSSPQKDSCQLCSDSGTLLTWFGYNHTASFNETQLESLLPGVLYMLTPIKTGNVGAVCNNSTGGKNFTENAFKSLLGQYGDGHGSLEEKQIDKLLEDINSTLRFRLTKKPCFDVDDALKESGLSEAVKNGKELEKLSLYLISNLLEGHCIAEHHHKASTLPAAKEFVEVLFKEYGVNGKISLAKFESLLKKLGIGNEPATTTKGGDHSGHDHRKRRSVVASEFHPLDFEEPHFRRRRSASNVSVTGKCFTPENILSIHSVKKTAGISQTQFKDICPTLIQQIEGGACKAQNAAQKTSFKETGWKPWLSAIVAVLIISLGSLVGILLAPFSEEKSFTLILTFLIAVAVSTLLGDAILHLFPHSLGLHKHEENTSHSHETITDKNSFVWKSLVFLVGVYFFYLFELYMHSLSKHEHSHVLQETHQHVGNTRSHSIVSGPVEILHDRKGKAGSLQRESRLIETVSGLHKCDEQTCIELEAVDEKAQDTSEVYINSECGNGNKRNRHVSESRALEDRKAVANGHSHVVERKPSKWKSVAWMVLIGDAIHNFLDGVAIGVAFTDRFPSGFFGGISTSIAILCHELPHELGDFAILIQSGLSIKMALALNFLSSLTSVLGAIIGVALGQAMDASSWIFALTAGLFVYIALADMLPELIHSAELRHSPMKTVIVQNAGLFVGFGIMICLAIFEDKIKL